MLEFAREILYVLVTTPDSSPVFRRPARSVSRPILQVFLQVALKNPEAAADLSGWELAAVDEVVRCLQRDAEDLSDLAHKIDLAVDNTTAHITLSSA